MLHITEDFWCFLNNVIEMQNCKCFKTHVMFSQSGVTQTLSIQLPRDRATWQLPTRRIKFHARTKTPDSCNSPRCHFPCFSEACLLQHEDRTCQIEAGLFVTADPPLILFSRHSKVSFFYYIWEATVTRGPSTSNWSKPQKEPKFWTWLCYASLNEKDRQPLDVVLWLCPLTRGI